jgi:hypothetical protein
VSRRIQNRIDEIDVRMDGISRLITRSAQVDRELAAGLGTQSSMAAIQSDIDLALASAEKVQRAIRTALGQEKSTRRSSAAK